MITRRPPVRMEIRSILDVQKRTLYHSGRNVL